MKKVFALALALAMVLSLASVAFAANSKLIDDEDNSAANVMQVQEDQAYTYDSDTKVMEKAGDTVEFGKTLYYVLTKNDNVLNPSYGLYYEDLITDSKSVSGLKITPKWTDGEEYVKNVEIVKKSVKLGGFAVDPEAANAGDRMSCYFVAVTTTGSELEDVDVSGKIYLKGTTGTGENKEKLDSYFTVDFSLAFEEVTKEVLVKDTKKVFATTTKKVYEMDNVDRDEVTVYFVPKADVETGVSKNAVASAVIDATNEEDVLLFYKVDEVESVVDAYPDANLDFVALTGKFKKTAEVTLYADEGTYLYKVVDGKVVAMDAEYDEWEEGFIFNAKTLGTYAISDVKLKAASAVETPGEGTTNNPTTGAAA